MALLAPLPVVAPQPVTLKDVVISHELLVRRIRKVNSRAEIAAMHEVANLLPLGTSAVMKRLAQLAVELCDAGTGGISMLEPPLEGGQVFRWEALAGELEAYVGGTTPRDWSPCGESLNAGRAMLYSLPARFFTYFQKVDKAIVEGLVIPMYAEGEPIGTIWIVSHDTHRHFDAEDVRVMTGLGSFVVAALRLSRRGPVDPQHNAGSEREVVWGEFVRRVARGDHSALGALIDETKPLVFGRALKMLSSVADAEETAADVYSQVWKTAARYDPERYNVTSWLGNIARSRAIDRLRSRARHAQFSEAALCSLCSTTIDPETRAADYQTTRNLRLAIGTLPAEQRRTIELIYFDGYSMAEAASRLGHPLGTVKTRVRMALIALRRLIATTETHLPARWAIRD